MLTPHEDLMVAILLKDFENEAKDAEITISLQARGFPAHVIEELLAQRNQKPPSKD